MIKQDKENIFERLQRSEKRLRLTIAIIFLIVSFAIIMIIIGVLSSLRL